MLILNYLKQCRKSNFGFFVFVVVVFVLYALQLVLKTEITPLGYFSLYSNETPKMDAYSQILPSTGEDNVPVDIYQLPGTGFILMEILPSRYQILKNAENCNQMNYKLKRIGLIDNNICDCENLKRFSVWYKVFAKRQGIELSDSYKIKEFGFLNGQIIRTKDVD
jgi:hypothetical protein